MEDNSYRLSILPYMHIYLVVNVENMKLDEPSMLDQEEKEVLHSIEHLAPYSQEDLVEDSIL